MIRSLRSLCLLKVLREGLSYKDLSPLKDLPEHLVNDLNLMKLFNGNFCSELEYYCEEEGLDALSMFSVSIFYDGVTWNISSRSEAIMLVHCCHFCNVFQPDLYELRVREGEPVINFTPFAQVTEWIGQMEDDYWRRHQAVEMKMTVDVQKDGWCGKITFHGAGGPYRFQATMRVNFTLAGTRVMDQYGNSFCYKEGSLETMNFCNKLLESEVSAKDEFKFRDSRYADDCPEWSSEEYDLEEEEEELSGSEESEHGDDLSTEAVALELSAREVAFGKVIEENLSADELALGEEVEKLLTVAEELIIDYKGVLEEVADEFALGEEVEKLLTVAEVFIIDYKGVLEEVAEEFTLGEEVEKLLTVAEEFILDYKGMLEGI